MSISSWLRSACISAAPYVCAATAGLPGAGVAIAAQSGAGPGGACTIVADSVIGPAHAIQGVNVPGLESCAVLDGAAPPITVMHIRGPITGSDMAGQEQGAGTSPLIDRTPVDGIGDSALLLRFALNEGTLVSLRVQVGDDVYAFNTADASDTPGRLMTLANAVLGGATATGSDT